MRNLTKRRLPAPPGERSLPSEAAFCRRFPVADIAHHTLTSFHARAFFPQILATLRLWRQRVREREQLARLCTRDLRDLGLSRTDIMDEIRKPFWRA
jgi:uncharacterized protein YjiS (DUF1127 family)